MTALLIKDIATSSDLATKDMVAVSGGCGMSPSSCSVPVYTGCGSSYGLPYGGPSFGLTKNDMNLNVAQQLGQSQNTLVNNGNNVAFASGITSNVAPSQNGSNNVNLF
ncbi:hypothetical protein [Noviherbaspirillum galbum]|uniref:Uncharacterized protein n=1 Tax=Noviherbaspirillum galbum TaxID=2709383 RepID=A0A6B3SRH2_9BURK|nr:hypothetical protein [Noviherbaspirillum galbum]NEX61935.1 hypothetical protein [Noviherbaspirillum galbum]